MRIGIFCDDNSVSVWQARALAALGAEFEILVYNCTNGTPPRRRLRHLLYYLLNLFTIRNRLTRSVKVESAITPRPTFDFEAEQDGLWQRLPPTLIERVRADQPAVLVKFGLGLLRIPPREELAPPILSYHHGDPDHYRGRPAGFYELLHGSPVMGQIVQILSNSLDAGQVVAEAETKAALHSYRATLMEAYSTSPLLLAAAIRNAVDGTTIPKACNGRNYRLPRNRTVARFCLRMAAAKARRLLYGAFVEKKWEVSIAEHPIDLVPSQETQFPARSQWRTLPRPRGYTFLADPFFGRSSVEILVEALRARTGRGELLAYLDGGFRKLLEADGHCSYPSTAHFEGETLVVPEICFWSDARAYRLAGERLEAPFDLVIEGERRLIDPTLIEHEGRWYLFANRLSEGHGVLRLWHSPSLRAPFREHPRSPVRISPAGSRMAGSIARTAGGLVRPAQDLRGDYGDGVILFRIDRLNPDSYSECEIGRLRFHEVNGPHTLDARDGLIAFDWYRNRFSPLAGVRRLLAWTAAPAAHISSTKPNAR